MRSKPWWQIINSKRGFTIVEILLVMVVLAIALGAIFTAYNVGFGLFRDETTHSDIVFEANRGLERMSKELQGALSLTAATSTGITFWWKDLNSSGSREADETVSFSWNGTVGGDLTRAVSSESTILAKSVRSFNLTYNSGTLANIRLITIQLTTASGTDIVTLESNVRPRNL